MIRCQQCGWEGAFEDLLNGNTCPSCFQIMGSNILKVEKIISIIN